MTATAAPASITVDSWATGAAGITSIDEALRVAREA